MHTGSSTSTRFSDDFYRRLVELSNQGIWVLDLLGKTLFVNAQMERMLGYTRAEMIGRPFLDFMSPAARELALQYLARRQDGIFEKHDFCFQHKDRSDVWTIVDSSEFIDSGERLILGVVTNISDRMALEDRLHQSEDAFGFVVNKAPILMWMSGVDKLCQWFNQPWLEFVGRSLDQESGSGWTENVHPEDLSNCLDVYTNAFDAREDFVIEYRLRRRDGEYRWLLDRGKPRYASDSRFLGYIGVCTDITPQKEQQRSLEEADKNKDIFLAMLGHELRNPLTPLRNSLTTLQLTAPHHPACASALQVMDREIQTLSRLLDDFLNLARFNLNKMVLALSECNDYRFIEEAVESVLPIAKAKQQKVHVQLPRESCNCVIDVLRIKQAIINLLVNATKFSACGEEIRVGVSIQDDDIVVVVSDHGIGIASDQFANLFDVFYQHKNEDKSSFGMGLGLPLVKMIVELHGGAVEAASDGLGRGACFTLRIPRQQNTAAPQETTAIASKPSLQESAINQSARSIKVLVVDDYPSTAESMAANLELLGHTAATAMSAEEAIAIANKLHPQLVLLDLGLPGTMNGMDLCRHLRTQDWAGQTMIAAFSGWGSVNVEKQALEAGFDCYLKKPANWKKIYNIIEKSIERSLPRK